MSRKLQLTSARHAAEDAPECELHLLLALLLAPTLGGVAAMAAMRPVPPVCVQLLLGGGARPAAAEDALECELPLLLALLLALTMPSSGALTVPSSG
jgi:hypothetical protein